MAYRSVLIYFYVAHAYVNTVENICCRMSSPPTARSTWSTNLVGTGIREPASSRACPRRHRSLQRVLVSHFSVGAMQVSELTLPREEF